MRCVMDSTDVFATLTIHSPRGDIEVQGRVWNGTTPRGVKFHAVVMSLAVPNGSDMSEFEAELLILPPGSAEERGQ
jgi:hypothetical protein